MSFLAPERLWLLLLVPALVAGYVLLQQRRGRYAVRFTNLDLLDSVAPRRAQWRQHVAVALALLTLASTIVLFARPAGTTKVPRQTPVTVVLTMDISLSMAAQDVSPNRITAAKRTAQQFLRSLPPTYNAALVTFARYATVVVPPTTDRARLDKAIQGLKLEEYTATGEGIYAALGVVRQALGSSPATPGKRKPALIVLISDGKRTVGRSQVAAAHAARRQGVPIYTVALGTTHGVIVNQGQQIPVPVEIGQLRQIAQISGGKSYVASDPSQLLDAYRDVHGSILYQLERADVATRYLGWLVLLMVITTGAGLVIASRWP